MERIISRVGMLSMLWPNFSRMCRILARSQGSAHHVTIEADPSPCTRTPAACCTRAGNEPLQSLTETVEIW